MFDPITLGLGALSAIPSVISGISQRSQANNLKLQNTETAAEREALAMSRQAASTARLPNQGYQEGRLAQVQAGAVQNARLGAASSSDFLASAGAASARRQAGEQQLGIQGQAYNDKAKGQLRQDLATQSRRQQHDLDTYNQTKAALLQGSATNLNNAVQTGVAYGAQAYNMGAGKGTTPTPENSTGGVGGGYNPYGNTMYNDPMGGFPMGGYGRQSRRYNLGGYNYNGQ